MKRTVSLLLIFALCFSLSGCYLMNVELADRGLRESVLEEPVVPETTKPAVETTQAPETETPTLPPIPQASVSDAYVDTLTVSDAYGTASYCYHIPKFDMDSPETESLNRAIYTELYELLESNVYETPEQPFLFGMSYDWIQVENIVSLLVYVEADWGLRLFKVYNAYADGSGVIPRDVLIESFGYTDSAFYDLVAQKLEEKYLTMYSQYPDGDSDPFYRQQLANTVSYDNVTMVIPFISQTGDFCCVATIYALAGADAYDYIVGLTGSLTVELPTCTVDHG